MEGSEAESCGEAFVPRHSCYPAVFTVLRVSPERVLVCFCFSTDLCALMPGKNSFLSVNLLKILKPLCGLSVRVDFLFWELCFNVLAIFFFSPPYLSHDSHFSFLPLFIQPPPISRNSPEEETLHPFFLLWYLKGLLWLSIQKLQKQHVVCVFGGLYLGEMLEVFPASILNLCKCLRVLCSAPFPLNKKHLLILQFARVSHLYEEKQKLFCHRGRICLWVDEGVFDWATLAGWQIASSYSFPQSCGRFGNGCETCWPSSPVFTRLVMTCITSLLWLLLFSIIFP